MKDIKVENNYFTQPDRRPPKSPDKGEIDEILNKHESQLNFKSMANVGGAKIQIKTNSKHVIDWWKLNWFLSDDNENPEGKIFVIKGVEGYDPHLFYNLKERKTLIVNSEYYGAAKSAGALGMAGVILEKRGGYPIHGACIGVEKNGINEGVIVIAPTGTGKTTQSHELLYSMRKSKVHSDDYVFVFFNGPNGSPNTIATEKQLYMRTDIAEQHPTFIHLFHDLPLENVVILREKCAQMHEEKEKMGPCYRDVLNGMSCVFENKDRCYWSYGNSRVMFPRNMFPMQIRDGNGYLHEVPKGKGNVINEAIVKYVFLLTRDDTTSPAKKLDIEEAIEILKLGKYLIRPGAGPKEKWGKTGFEPFYNPYPPELNKERQEKFFRELFKHKVLFYLLNTGSFQGVNITPHQTHTYIRRIVES